jgi:formylglycine-generating enzyme required for sulfatase activity
MTETNAFPHCPSCGEPVQPTWRICPMCETRLQAPACPFCRKPVKENWKRCPECEALLVCPGCGGRLAAGQNRCPVCKESSAPTGEAESPLPAVFTDIICDIEMVYIPGGAFQMGDTFGGGMENEQPVHTVRLDGFYIGRTTVTQAQWLQLIPDNPSKFEGDRHPVEQVTWDQARQFARLLTEAHQGRYTFDLPSEAQWEYAARSGGRQELYAGGDLIDKLGWYEANSRGRTHPAGEKEPNDLGLYDMSGNVWEWCLDSFTEDAYPRHKERNPLICENEADQVIRGGSWHLDAWSARCARRFSFPRDLMGPGLGFRLVMVPKA